MKRNNVENVDKRQCYGCACCTAVCVQNAVSMELSEDGFLYPNVAIEKCISCGICIEKCPLTSTVQLSEPNEYRIGQYFDKDIINSSSGGAFIAIAKVWIQRGGWVVGCEICDDTLLPRINITNSLSGLYRMQGSKYIQAEFGKDVYQQINKHLTAGNKVLCFGTPCQIAAIKKYIGNNVKTDNLYCVDLICHGVGSRSVFKSYLDLKKKELGDIYTYSFRDKRIRAFPENYTMYIRGSANDYRKMGGRDPYLNAFSQGRILRESCYRCPYSTQKRTGDLSVGDYFQKNGILESMNISKGISLISVNNTRGEYLLSLVEDSFLFNKIKSVNKKNLIRPSSRPKERDYLNSFDINNAQEAKVKKILKITPADYIRSVLPRDVKQQIKKLLHWK